MTATPSIDLPGWMAEQLSQASPDLLRNMIQTFAEALMSADADAVCGAGYGQRSPDRSNTRNGYRHRGWDTRAGSDRPGHPEAAGGQLLPGVAAGAAPAGRVRPDQRGRHLLSARGVDAADGEAGRAARHHPAVSKSQVSEMAKDLDGQVEAFRTRPLDAGPYTFVAADALVLKVREGGRTVNVHALLATGVNATATGRSSACKSPRRGRRRLARVLP